MRMEKYQYLISIFFFFFFFRSRAAPYYRIGAYIDLSESRTKKKGRTKAKQVV